MTNNNNNPDKKITQPKKTTEQPSSHTLFGRMMKDTLRPLKLEVETNYEVGKAPPKLDVLIIRRKGDMWSQEQLNFLPDGVRQKKCKYVILELKYTESINQIAIFQTMGYLGSYLKTNNISIDDACSFLVSAKTPNKKTIKKLNFEETSIKGVYQSTDKLLDPLSLITLNDLSDKHYNLWVKLFSSKKSQKLTVLQKILSLDLKKISQDLIVTIIKIMKFWDKTGEISMQTIKRKINPELLDSIDEELVDFFFAFTGPERIVKRLKPSERLMGLKPSERLMGLKPGEVIPQFKPEEVIPQFKPEERLKGLDIKIIERYLEEQKKQKIHKKHS